MTLTASTQPQEAVPVDDLPREEVLAVVDQMVDELLESAAVRQPPVDAIALAQQHLGMVVCLDKRQLQRGRAQRSSGQQQAIYLRPEPTVERHQWTVAHEIGEHLKAELFRRLDVNPGEARAMAGESLANLFAHRLLVPSVWFNEDALVYGYDLPALKKRYPTSSHEVLALRFLDLGEACVVTVIDNERVSKRRSNGPRVTRRLHPAEEKCSRLVHETGRPRRVRAGVWTVQGWPIHTSEWKREILRAVVDDAD